MFKLLASVFCLLSCLAFANLETIPAGEEAAIQEITQMISAQVRKQFQEDGLAVRDAHAKAHGCVRGIFTVNDTLSPDLQSTVFSPGKPYSAWIRYSNGSGKSQNDNEGDGRGMAIKLMGVSGAKLSKDENFTQDFLMINNPTFFVRNVVDYVDFTKAVGSGNPLKFFFPSANPFGFRLHELKIARATQKKVMNDPLASQYWSMTPYLFSQKAIKYSARSCFKGDEVVTDRSSPNFLREAMAKHLERQGACFEFMIQRQESGDPIEDPTIEWSGDDIKIATLTIPKQEFDSAEQMRFCENISMNPWHCVEEHRPLGGINRARRVVYDTISTLRHELNKEKKTEPTGNERF